MIDRVRRTDGWLGRRSLLRAAIGAAICTYSHIAAEAAEPIGKVEDVRGDAFREDRSQHVNLVVASPLFLNDVVGTGAGSRATLHLGTDTVVRMGENARLTIDRFLANAGGEITLESGPILYEHREGVSAGQIRIRSAFGMIAVRGTRLFAGPSAGVFGVFVERGVVAVTTSGARVVLTVGEGTNIAAIGAVPTPPAPWSPERIRLALESVQ